MTSIIAFDLKGNLIHFNREAKKLLNRVLTILDLTVFAKSSKRTLGDLLYMNPTVLSNVKSSLQSQYLRLNFLHRSKLIAVGGIIVVIHDVTSRKSLSSHVVTLLRTCHTGFVHRLQQSSLTPKRT